ncbi:hypothetical protein C5L39_00295 [Corynebacterium alimapuense]|uniref:Major facilitator superfamily (MFS) profile domain-containing protein n=2 Tax=Corynebacterium alimapuense TaxID=1576874 RepID=A0A3M8KA75_9CORY|nr:hypothetical protein C5L39_00295 [Corynebacterium alimapuense]
MVGVDNSILYTTLPALQSQLGATSTQSLWIINAYPLVLAGLLLGTGTLGDRIGHRLMFIIGLSIFGIASLTAAFSPNAWILIGARAFLGFGAAVLMPATLALIRLTFTEERERNTAIGVWASVAVLGAAAGPVVGGLLLEHFWWGSVFLINVPVVVVALIATFAIAPPNLPDPNRHWDVISSMQALLTLTGLVIVIKEAANPARSWWVLLPAFLVCILGATAFARRQRKLEDPLLAFDIFRNPVFSGGVIAAAGAMFVVSGLELMTTQHFQLNLGYSPLEAGLVVVAVTITAFPFSILGGAILHRVGFFPLITGGFLSITAGVSLAAWFSTQEFLPGFIVGLLLVGAGAGSIMSVSSTAIIGSAPLRRAGMASGVEAVSYEFGTLLSVAILGSLLPLLSADVDRAYTTILVIIAVSAAAFAAVTSHSFRGNPKGATHA